MPSWPGRNFDVPGQGSSTNGYYGTNYTPYGSGVGHSGITPDYDTPPSHSPRQYPVGPSSYSEDGYPAQSANLNFPHPPSFVPQQNPGPRPMTPPGAWSQFCSQRSASAWDAWAGATGSYSLQSTSESYSQYTPGGFACEQGMLRVNKASLPRHPASVQRALREQHTWTPITKKRKALVVGTNYPGSDPRYRLRLKFCTEDAYCMANFLQDKLHFARNDIRIMTDDRGNPHDLPTEDNILEAMRTLVRGAQPGDSFFFYFSGHGTQIKDMDGDEADGLDECILAMDFSGKVQNQDSNTPGLIVDDIMHEIMVKYLPEGCRLTAIFDCCHSGTILDLPVVYNSEGVAKPFVHRDGPWAGSQKLSSADVVSLSASKDNQDAEESPKGGALRWAFIDSVSRYRYGDTLTYKALVRNMRDYMVRNRFKQKPQLSSAHRMDTNLLFVV